MISCYIYRRIIIHPPLPEVVEFFPRITQAVDKRRVGRHGHMVMVAVEVFHTVFPVPGAVSQNRRMVVDDLDAVFVIFIDCKSNKFVDQVKVKEIIPAEVIAENHCQFNFGSSRSRHFLPDPFFHCRIGKIHIFPGEPVADGAEMIGTHIFTPDLIRR